MVARGPRHQAKLAGDLHYFTGIPCRAGHVSVRVTDNGSCIECRRERERATYKNRYESKIKPRLQKKENLKKAAEKMMAAFEERAGKI